MLGSLGALVTYVLTDPYLDATGRGRSKIPLQNIKRERGDTALRDKYRAERAARKAENYAKRQPK